MEETYFISHGAPTLCIDDSLEARGFLKSFREKIQSQKPKGILVVSAHWDTSEPALTTNSGKHDTIHDFYGFPKLMYQLKYPAPGTPELAMKVSQLLEAAGFNNVQEDKKRGLDHGAWVPLMLMYPEAEIPVCQLSVQSSRSGTYHYEMGRALAPLRKEGYLIIGSGAATHNFRAVQYYDGTIASWALEFDNWLRKTLLDGKYDDVKHYEEKAPNARIAHPSPEHIYPLHVALGAAGEKSKAELIHLSWGRGTFSYASYKFVASNEM